MDLLLSTKNHRTMASIVIEAIANAELAVIGMITDLGALAVVNRDGVGAACFALLKDIMAQHVGAIGDVARWHICAWLQARSRFFHVNKMVTEPHDWLTGFRIAAKQAGYGYCELGPWYRRYGIVGGFTELAEPAGPSAAPHKLGALYEDSGEMQQSNVVSVEVDMTQGGVAPTPAAAGSSTEPAPSVVGSAFDRVSVVPEKAIIAEVIRQLGGNLDKEVGGTGSGGPGASSGPTHQRASRMVV